MKKKVRSVYNIEDFKTPSGLWGTTYTVTTDIEYIQYWSRSFRLWVKINGRCSVGGYICNERPNYAGCLNLFKDFQEFACWCQTQEGYRNKDSNGKYWSIDKDIIGSDGNYSPENCCFIPNYVNQIFTSKWNGKVTERKKAAVSGAIEDITIPLNIREAILNKWERITGDSSLRGMVK